MNKHCPHCGGNISLARRLLSLEGYYAKKCPHCKKKIKLKTLGIFPTSICVALVACIYFCKIEWIRIVCAISLLAFLIFESARAPIISGEDED